MGLTREMHNGLDLLDPKSPLQVRDDGMRFARVLVTRRIGIRHAVELPLRFSLPGNECVSGPRRMEGKLYPQDHIRAFRRHTRKDYGLAAVCLVRQKKGQPFASRVKAVRPTSEAKCWALNTSNDLIATDFANHSDHVHQHLGVCGVVNDVTQLMPELPNAQRLLRFRLKN